MDNFEQRIADAVTRKLSDGTVEKIIEQKIEKAVSDALEDIFKWNGAGKKLIEDKLGEVIVPVIERHDFNQYLVKLDSALTEIVNATNLADNKAILGNFEDLMKNPDFEEINLSEIFNRYCQHVAANVDTSDLEAECEDGEPYYQHVTATLEVEHVDKSWYKSRFDDCYVKFMCEEDEDLNCQLRLYKDQNEDRWHILRGAPDSIDINSLRNLSDFQVFLSILQRSFIKIIMDTQSEYDDDIEPDEKPEWNLN